MSERNRDPGAPLDSQGIPDIADDSSPEREELPEPQRHVTPTERPVASMGYGTTSAETRAGETLERKLARENREETEDPLRPRDPGQPLDDPAQDGEGVVPPYDEQSRQNLSPYERQIPPAEEDLAQHEGP
jgi:hypothetical protein